MVDATAGAHDVPSSLATASSPKRANGRSVSSTDCHTCASLNRRCDRQRPQCSTCLARNETCGGFATALSWDRGWTWLGRPSSKASRAREQKKIPLTQAATSSSPSAALNHERAPHPSKPARTTDETFRQFKFVEGRPSKRRKLQSEESYAQGFSDGKAASLQKQSTGRELGESPPGVTPETPCNFSIGPT